MEEKKTLKISLKIFIILVIAILVVIGILCLVINRYSTKTNSNVIENSTTTTKYNSNTSINNTTNDTKPIIIANSTTDNSYSTNSEDTTDYSIKTGYYSGSSNMIENVFVSSYSELEKYANRFGEITIDNVNILNHFSEDFFLEHTLAIEAHDGTYSNNQYSVDSVTLDGTKANINITHTKYSYGEVLSPNVQFIFITLNKNIKSAMFNINTKSDHIPHASDLIHDVYDEKPIIYLYPEVTSNVKVKLGKSENITCSYPKYIDGWNVLAYPNGDLIDINTNRNLYSLYYESDNEIAFSVTNEGFIVKGEDIATFLEEKLAILGLTEREAEEFIIYWLPKLESNKYNYIRFATVDEINKNMPLEINPKPDTIIRILMTYKGLDTPIEINEQNLTTPERTGFVAVEWGGTEIK